MTDEQKALYKQEKVDGKGRLQFFVSCWDGLQLLFQKFMKQGKARGDVAFDCMLSLSRDLMGRSFWRTGRLIAFKKFMVLSCKSCFHPHLSNYVKKLLSRN
jgi:hypothetical protein